MARRSSRRPTAREFCHAPRRGSWRRAARTVESPRRRATCAASPRPAPRGRRRSPVGSRARTPRAARSRSGHRSVSARRGARRARLRQPPRARAGPASRARPPCPSFGSPAARRLFSSAASRTSDRGAAGTASPPGGTPCASRPKRPRTSETTRADERRPVASAAARGEVISRRGFRRKSYDIVGVFGDETDSRVAEERHVRAQTVRVELRAR